MSRRDHSFQHFHPSTHGRSVLLGWCALLLLVGTISCTPSAPWHRWVIAERWIPDAPTVLYSQFDAGILRTVFDWTFAGDELANWTVTNPDGVIVPVKAGLRLNPGSTRPHLVREVSLQADAIAVIEAEIDGVSRGSVRLLWSGPGESFSAERSTTVDARDIHDSVVRFDLSQNPAWTGSLRRLRLEPTSALDQKVVVRHLRGLRVVMPEADSTADLFTHPWRFDLGHVVRSAMPLRAGRTWTRKTVVPANARLQFAYGLDGTLSEPVELVLESRADPGTPLFRQQIVPEDRIRGWHQVAIDLSPLAGREVELVFRVSGSQSDSESGLVAIADPLLLAPAERTSRQPNVILIVVDTLRADRVAALRNGNSLTPNIDRWFAGRGATFDDVVAPAPWTLPSHISLFTGLDALHHGLNHDQGATPDLTTLAELLRGQGYHTAAVTGGVYLYPGYGLDQGFDEFHYWPPDRSQGDELEENGAYALELLAELHDRPFFFFFHTYEVHSPFHRRQPFFDRLVAGHGDPDAVDFRTVRQSPDSTNGFVDERRFVVRDEGIERPIRQDERWAVEAAYDSGVAYTDVVLGHLLDQVSALGLDESTLVILTSDHGEALGERGLAAHAYLLEFNLEVPLLLALPGGRNAGARIERQVRLIDVPATIAAVAGSEFPTAIDGHSLLPLLRDGGAPFPEAAWSYAGSTNRGVSLRSADGYKLIYRSSLFKPGIGERELYYLPSDPLESRNLASEQPALAGQQVRAVEQRLLVDPPGLLILVDNADRASYDLVLAPAPPNRVKGIGVPPTLQATRDRLGLHIELPPASRFGLRLEALSSDDVLELQITGAGRAPCSLSLPLADLRPDFVVAAGPRGCEYGLRDRQTAALTLDLRITGASLAETTAPADPGISGKLKELGYL